VELVALPIGTSILSGASATSSVLKALFLAVKLDSDDAATQLLQIDYTTKPPTVQAPLHLSPGTLLGLAVDDKLIFAWMGTGTATNAQVSLGTLDLKRGVVTPVQSSPYANVTAGSGPFAVNLGMLDCIPVSSR
jgi:hypothetical protein